MQSSVHAEYGDKKQLEQKVHRPTGMDQVIRSVALKQGPHPSSPRICFENSREGYVLKPKQTTELGKSSGGDWQCRGQHAPILTQKLAD